MKLYLPFETLASNLCSLVVEIHDRGLLKYTGNFDDNDILFYSAFEFYFRETIHVGHQKGF